MWYGNKQWCNQQLNSDETVTQGDPTQMNKLSDLARLASEGDLLSCAQW